VYGKSIDWQCAERKLAMCRGRLVRRKTISASAFERLAAIKQEQEKKEILLVKLATEWTNLDKSLQDKMDSKDLTKITISKFYTDEKSFINCLLNQLI